MNCNYNCDESPSLSSDNNDHLQQAKVYAQGRIQGERTPPKIGKNMIFLRKIVIFHTKYPKIFAPPSARRNFFKCAPPPTWNPGSTPDVVLRLWTIK